MFRKQIALLVPLFIILSLQISFVLSNEASNNTQPKRILFLAAYQKSTIISTQGLAEELSRRGYEVQYASTEDDIDLVTSVREGVKFLSAGKAPESPLAADIFGLWHGESLYARSMYDTLLPKLKENPPDLIVFEPLSIAGEALANSLEVESVQVVPHLISLGFLGSEPTSSHPMLISGMATSQMSFFDRVKNGVLVYVARYILPAVRANIQSDFRKYAGLDANYFEFQNQYGKTKLAIIGNVIGFENPRDLPPLVQSTGPFLPRSAKLTTSLSEWFERSNLPVIYVSIGTNSVWTKESASAVTDGLIKFTSNNSYRVLWSIKSEQINYINPILYSKVKNDDSIFRFESFVDQFAVLSHPLTKVFVTHGGLSSITESLWNGVPYVIIPMMLDSDQPTNGARSEELGLGVWLDRRKSELTTDTFYNALVRVVNEESFRIQAQRFKTIYRTFGGASAAADLIELSLSPVNIVELWQLIEDYTCYQCFLLVVILYLTIKWLRR